MNSPNVVNWIESTERRWSSSERFFPGFTTLQILGEIQNTMTETQCEPGNSQDGLFSCQCTMTLYGEKKETRN